VSNQTEEQQIEQLKEWWKDNGTPLMIGAVLGLSGFFGWKYMTEKEVSYQESASNLYVSVTEELTKEDKSGLAEKAQSVKEQYPDSSYAILSAFHLAKIAVEENDLDKAAAEFNWVINNHKGNELAPIAKLRLARIYIAQKKAEQALSLLSFSADSGYFEVASLIKGHALNAMDKKAEALEAYRAADNAGNVTANHPTLKLAIEELAASEIGLIEQNTAVETETKEATEEQAKTDEETE